MTAAIEIFRGNDFAPYLKRLSQMRMTHYRGYPYLYEGSDDYEHEYIADFPNNQHSIMVGAFESGELEGFVLGTPLEGDSPILASISDKVHRRATTYYIADIILNSGLRAQRISETLMNTIEREIISLGYKQICFLTVFRPENHPTRPPGYVESRALWERFGYVKQPAKLTYDWASLNAAGNLTMQTHEMNLWSKIII